MEASTIDVNNDSCVHFTPQQKTILTVLYLSGGSISFVFCLIIFFIAILFEKYRQSTQRMILYLTISVSLLAIANILHGARRGSLADNSHYCVTIAFIDQVTNWMVLMAVCCLTFDLFLKVVFLKFDTTRCEPLYCLIIFVVPFAFNWIPFIKQAYGLTGEQCWIKLTKKDNCTQIDDFYVSVRLILYWIPFVIILVLVSITYAVVLIKSRRQLRAYSGKFNPSEHTMRHLLYREVRWYMIYPVLMLIAVISAVILRIIEMTNTTRPYFGLRILHILAISLQGVVIAIVFALDYDTREQITSFNSVKAALYNLFCYCKNKRKIVEYETIPGQFYTDSLSTSDQLATYGGSISKKMEL